MNQKFTSLLLTLCLTFSLSSCGNTASSSGASSQVKIQLSDKTVTVDGQAASTDAASAVYVGSPVIYYEAGHDDTYGAGSEEDGHTAAEAEANTVVTITMAGTYRISGTLSAGQLAVDLGEDAKEDSSAVVTLILDGADITCTVAPAVIFYSVYECGSKDTETATSAVDTSAAGANVVIGAGSTNNISGSHVAKIYKEGTTDKLNKFDGAFYSKMSMNVSAEDATGVLNITSDNEGLDSELHLTINSGIINIEAQDDGINTNEDSVSVTAVNGGTLTINAGLGAEGDGIDSNGYLVINGGTIWTMANEQSPDGGVDADGDILINGGTLMAFGTRNDAAGADSAQTFIELSFASTLASGSVVMITDSAGSEMMGFTTRKNCQSITLSSPGLSLNTTYYVYLNGVQQQYTGNSFGMMGGGMGNMENPPEGTDTAQSGDIPKPGGGMTPPSGTNGAPGGGNTPPDGASGTTPSGSGASVEPSVEFVITSTVHSFSGVSDSTQSSGKTAVTFTLNDGVSIDDVSSGSISVSSAFAVLLSDGTAAAVPENQIQITITDLPSENYAATCLLSDVEQSLSGLLPADAGTYQLTLSVVSANETYTGTGQWQFTLQQLKE